MVKLSEFDKFGVDAMGKDEYSAKHAEMMKECKCTSCPSYVKGDMPYAYCYPMGGASKAIKKEVDCYCEACPVYGKYELDHMYYCTRCSELCQVAKVQLGGGHE